jgi:hypothetical protein
VNRRRGKSLPRAPGAALTEKQKWLKITGKRTETRDGHGLNEVALNGSALGIQVNVSDLKTVTELLRSSQLGLPVQ